LEGNSPIFAIRNKRRLILAMINVEQLATASFYRTYQINDFYIPDNAASYPNELYGGT